MASIDDITADIVEDFEVFDNWMDKYEFIIDMSKSLAPMPAEKKQDINLIKGCQSQVWLDVQLDDKGLMLCHADARTLRWWPESNPHTLGFCCVLYCIMMHCVMCAQVYPPCSIIMWPIALMRERIR